MFKGSDEGLQNWSPGCAICRQTVSEWNWVWPQEVWGTAERTWGTKKKTKHSEKYSSGVKMSFGNVDHCHSKSLFISPLVWDLCLQEFQREDSKKCELE